MNVIVTEPVQITLRNLSDDERRRVWAWLDNLKNWEPDSDVRQHSKRLESSENDYVLMTSSDVRVFFRLEENSITVLDVARKATIVSSGQASGAD